MERKKDAIISLSLIILGGLIIYGASSFPQSIMKGTPSPAFFPNLLGGILIILSSCLLYQSIRGGGANESVGKFNWQIAGKVAISIGLLIIFPLVMEKWDTFVAIPLLMMPIMFIMGERNIKYLILIPMIFDAVVYGVFLKIFGVALPTIYF